MDSEVRPDGKKSVPFRKRGLVTGILSISWLGRRAERQNVMRRRSLLLRLVWQMERNIRMMW